MNISHDGEVTHLHPRCEEDIALIGRKHRKSGGKTGNPPLDMDLLSKAQFSEKVDGEWNHYLDGSEFKLLRWLLRLTLGWNRRDGYYSLDQIVSGIEDHCLGVGICRRTLGKTIASLRTKGVVSADSSTGRSRTHFTINFAWEPTAPHAPFRPGEIGTTGPTVIQLPISKRKRAEIQAQEGDRALVAVQMLHQASADVAPQWGNSCTSYNNNTTPADIKTADTSLGGQRVEARRRVRRWSEVVGKFVYVTQGSEGVLLTDTPELCLGDVTPKATLEAAAARAAAKTTSSPQVKVDAAYGQARASALAVTWADAWRSAYRRDTLGREDAGRGVSEAPRWKAEENGIASAFIKRWNGTGRDLHDMVRWSVERWEWVLQAKFAWMKKSPPPVLPSLGFLSKFQEQFLEAWHEDRTRHWLSQLPEEQAHYERLRRTKTHEEAILEIATSRALAMDRQQRASDKARAEQVLRVAQIELEKAKRIGGRGMYSAENPHPNAVIPVKPGAFAREAEDAGLPYEPIEFPPWEDIPKPRA